MTGIAWLSDVALDEGITQAELGYLIETGGVMIGYWVNQPHEVVVTVCTRPGPKARHRKYQYYPDPEHDEAEIARHYQLSGRRHTYLGDWHTHPDRAPYLSRTDRDTLLKISSYPAARAPNPLMAILGGQPGGWLLQLWCYSISSNKGSIAPLHVRLYSPRADNR